MKKLLAVLACALSLCGMANAEIVKFKYTGIVSLAYTDSASGHVWGTAAIDGFNIKEGYIVTGTIAYDTSNPKWFVDKYANHLYQGYGLITATVLENGFTLTTARDYHNMSVANDSSLWGGTHDVFSLNGYANDANGNLARLIDFSVFDRTGTAFDNTSIPANLDLDHFQQKDMTVNYIDGDYWTGFNMNFSSFEQVRDVPEPTSAALLFAGLGLLIGVRRFSARTTS